LTKGIAQGKKGKGNADLGSPQDSSGRGVRANVRGKKWKERAYDKGWGTAETGRFFQHQAPTTNNGKKGRKGKKGARPKRKKTSGKNEDSRKKKRPSTKTTWKKKGRNKKE